MTMSRHNAASNVHDLRGIGKHNVSHLIYVLLIAPNTSVYPTAIVSSNHEPINQLHCCIHIRTISETHLDNTFDDTVVAIHGYNIYRKDRNANVGSVAVYIQNHIPVMIRDDLMLNTVEVIWLQVHLPHLKPILV